ncbi:MAG: nucleoside-diphosphate kinase [bacterium]
MTKEKSLVLIKPDVVCKNKIGELLKYFEKKDLKIIALKMIKLQEKDVDKFYEMHKDKDFFIELKKFMLTAPCIACVIEGENAISKIRKIIGHRIPQQALKNTIRYKLGSDGRRNAIHGSDSLEASKKEIACFFKEKEILNYNENDWLNSQPG